MELAIEKVKDVVIVMPRAEFIDASNYQEFKQDIASLLEANRLIVLDISQLRFVDSSGLGAILSCLRKLASTGGDLKLLCNKSKPVRMFFELVRMNRIIEMFTTRQDALDAFAKGPTVAQ